MIRISERYAGKGRERKSESQKDSVKQRKKGIEFGWFGWLVS